MSREKLRYHLFAYPPDEEHGPEDYAWPAFFDESYQGSFDSIREAEAKYKEGYMWTDDADPPPRQDKPHPWAAGLIVTEVDGELRVVKELGLFKGHQLP